MRLPDFRKPGPDLEPIDPTEDLAQPRRNESRLADPVTEPTPVLTTDDPAPPDDLASDLEDWPVGGPAKGMRLRLPTAVLAAGVVAALGFWAGAVVQKHRAGQTTVTGAAAAAGATNATRTTGAAGAAGAGAAGPGATGAGRGNATIGTIKNIDGSTLYITDSTGDTIAVTVSPSATVTRNATSSVTGLHPGDTVIVQGTKNADGTTTALSVSASASGVTGGFAGRGGFGGARGGGGGGAGTTPSTTAAGGG